MAERVNQSAVETVAGRVDKSVGKRMRGGERERGSMKTGVQVLSTWQ